MEASDGAYRHTFSMIWLPDCFDDFTVGARRSALESAEPKNAAVRAFAHSDRHVHEDQPKPRGAADVHRCPKSPHLRARRRLARPGCHWAQWMTQLSMQLWMHSPTPSRRVPLGMFEVHGLLQFELHTLRSSVSFKALFA